MTEPTTTTKKVRRKGQPFSRVVPTLTALPNGKVAYFHPTKGVRNRRPTVALMTAFVKARISRLSPARLAEVAQ